MIGKKKPATPAPVEAFNVDADPKVANAIRLGAELGDTRRQFEDLRELERALRTEREQAVAGAARGEPISVPEVVDLGEHRAELLLRERFLEDALRLARPEAEQVIGDARNRAVEATREERREVFAAVFRARIDAWKAALAVRAYKAKLAAMVPSSLVPFYGIDAPRHELPAVNAVLQLQDGARRYGVLDLIADDLAPVLAAVLEESRENQPSYVFTPEHAAFSQAQAEEREKLRAAAKQSERERARW